jgi:hypothetical protein
VVFLNLSFAQFLTLFGAIGAFSVALYLLDRARRKQMVATLRFWVAPGQSAPVTRRRKIQQPVSLLLQLLGMLLLLLAIAQFQWGSRRNLSRDHVLILDTSAWMGATVPNRNGATLMEFARANALGWLKAVPTADRVMLIRADALATPVTAWELDRRKVAKAILDSQPGATALNLSQSLTFARQLQGSSNALPGEIAYAGPGRISSREANNMQLPTLPAFRIMNVDDSGIENSGLRSVGARRSGTDSGAWDVIVRVRNYGKISKTVSVTLNLGHAPQGGHAVELPAGAERELTFPVHATGAGILEARLYPKDAFAADNFVALELPEVRSLNVTVYTEQPELIRPALASDSRVIAQFKTPAQYTPVNNGLVILDKFHPDVRPPGNVLWIDPPADKPPVPIRERIDHPEALQWSPDQPLTTGLRARDVQIDSTSVFEPGPNEIRVAEIDKGPIMIARESDGGKTRMVVMGFDPFTGAMRYELATPLLLANVLRWVAPDVFREVDVGAQSAGPVSMPVASDKGEVKVITDNGTSLPFNVRDRSVQFFAGESERVRVISGNAERVYSLTLPELWDVKWTPPANVRHGIPSWTESLRSNRDLWPWLSSLGALLLLVEWIVYGRYSTRRLHVVKSEMETVKAA